MRWLLTLACPLLVSASYPDRPPFEFKEYTAGESVDPKKIRKCSGRDGVKSCLDMFDKVAGASATTMVDFYNSRLTLVYARIRRGAFPAVVDAVTAKYGPPCRSSTSDWRNAMGARLDNLELVWCFRTGELTLREIGSNLDYMFFGYLDEYQAPRAAPTVDF